MLVLSRTQMNVLTQAAQANQQPQSVLQLLHSITAESGYASEKQLLSLKTQILPVVQAKPLFLCEGYVSGISAAGADAFEKQFLSLKTQILPAVQAKPLFLCEGYVSGISAAGADASEKQFLSLKTQILPAVQAKPLFLRRGGVNAPKLRTKKSSPMGALFLC